MTTSPPTSAPQWLAVQLDLAGPRAAQPYVEIEAWAVFTHTTGTTLRRQVCWDGGADYFVRFASPLPDGAWDWEIEAVGNEFSPASGRLVATAADLDQAHPARRHGFCRVASSARALVHADGSPSFVVADTPWGLPWRATVEDAAEYARERQAKGFNAALLMSVQPDMHAEGPDARGVDYGFARGFGDLPEGRLTKINVDYFRYLDKIIDVLLDHAITPVLQPVFFGFGWKGLQVAGPVVPDEDYARYCRYLVARYGASPAYYLVGADGSGVESQVEAGGRAIHAADAYGQPTGLHYRPHATNDAHQGADWLDFQWCQTGHEGDHVPDRLATMWRCEPPKPIMNGEPTYENSGRRGKGAGWWQGHEAWSNLCAGSIMGVAYGAGSLWQWRISPDEPGHEAYFIAEGAGWREALEFDGSSYVGLVGKILAGLPLAGLEPCWDVGLCTRGLLDPGVLYIGYAEHGGRWMLLDAEDRVPSQYWLIDPTTGAVLESGTRPSDRQPFADGGVAPRVLICADATPRIAGSGRADGLR